MHVRIIHSYFFPDLSSVSQVVSDLAFHLSSRGHKVSVLASRNYYTGVGRERLHAEEDIHGVSVCRIWGPSLGKGSVFARLADQLFFATGATVVALVAQKADIVVLLTHPPLFSILGLVLKRLRRERFVYIVMDLYPDIPIRAGFLKAGSLSAQLMSWVTRKTLQGADQVIVPGASMRDAVIARGADASKTLVIRNWADENILHPPDQNENDFRKAHGLYGRFVVMYSGNMGVAHRFDEILEVARRLREREDICFVFIGDGVRRKEIQEFQEANGLRNLLLLPYQDRAQLGESLGAGDVHFASLREEFEGLMVPSKIYGVMAAGRPVIYQGNPKGEIGRLVIERDIGTVVPDGDTDGLEAAILRLHKNRALAADLGKRARTVLEQNYSMRQAVEAYESAFLAGIRMHA